MLEVREVKKSFSGRTILNNISVNFKEGKAYALIGESGSGKTTLLNLLGKLEEYDSGQILYNNHDICSLSSHHFFRDYLGYLFQNFGLMESHSIDDNLNLGLVGKKLSKEEKNQVKLEVLQKVNLSHLLLKQKIFELSGGEAQRVALAKIILKDPPIILADEPTAALDPRNAEEVMDILLSLKSQNKIIIIATHNPVVWERADVIIKMNEL
ncbi:MAG: ABC transporter ATP-binding protein [Streptococcus sp.]|nr:ABC transporter ATP-binding protein [Streptococcus sp.]